MKTSVAICTYNGEKYIYEQLESILNQTILPDEIIICDDCSTDNTLQIIEDLKCGIENDIINVVKNEKNIGAKNNFSKAIKLCSSELIFLSDQDDIWLPNKIEEFILFLKHNSEAKVVFSDGTLINEEGNSFTNYSLFELVNFNDEAKQLFNKGFFWELQNIHNRVTGATLCFYKSYIAENEIIPFMSGNIWHDEIIAVNAALDNCIGFIDKCLIKYRIHTKQQAGIDFQKKINNDIWNYYKLNPYYPIIRKDVVKKMFFYQKREKMINSFFGFLKIIFNIKLYEIYYDDYSELAIKSDLNNYFKSVIKRLKSSCKSLMGIL